MLVSCIKLFSFNTGSQLIVFETDTSKEGFKTHHCTDTIVVHEHDDTLFTLGIKQTNVSNGMSIPYLRQFLNEKYGVMNIVSTKVTTIYAVSFDGKSLHYDFQEGALTLGDYIFQLKRMMLFDAIADGMLGFKYAEKFVRSLTFDLCIAPSVTKQRTDLGVAFRKAFPEIVQHFQKSVASDEL